MTDPPKPPFKPNFSNPAVESVRRLQNSLAAQENDWQRTMASVNSAADAKWKREEAATQRGVDSLALTGQLVNLQEQLLAKQQEILDLQKSGGEEQDRARRRELLMIWISAAALVVAMVGIGVAIAVA